MKITKCTSLLLAFLLLVSNLGLAFNVHYCGDEIASVSIKTIAATPNSVDECCGIAEKKTQCCNDKVVNFQEKTDDLILKTIVFSAYTNTVFGVQWTPIISSGVLNIENKFVPSYSFEANAPPFFLLYSQYIFYA